MESQGDTVVSNGTVEEARQIDGKVSRSNSSLKQPKRTNNSFHHVRYLIIVLGGMAVGAMFLMRLSITVAMLRMVNHTEIYIKEHPNTTVDDFFAPDYVEVGEFNWKNEIQQSIISGYMIAYTIPQVMTTRLGLIYGLRITISISLALCGLSCVLTPYMAYWGWEWVLVLRFLNGLGASAILPTMIGAIEKWMPYHDSAKGLSLLQFVQTFLYAATPLISGLLTSIHWQWAFYVPGVTGLSFAIIWWILARDDPDSCLFISQKEVDLIKGISIENDDSSSADKKKVCRVQKKPPRLDLPWYFMFKVKSFPAFVAIWMLYCATFGGFLFLLPSYLNRVLKLSVEDNGFYNTVIQVGVLFSMLWSNPVISFLQNRFNMSLTAARRIVVFIYTLMSILSWCYVAAFHDYLIVAICINRFFHMTNDTIITATLMSQFGKDGLSSVVYSMMNSFGNMTSVLFCWAVGRFLDVTGESLECWSWVFVAMSALNVLLFLIYAIFLKSEPVTIKSAKQSQKENDKKCNGGNV